MAKCSGPFAANESGMAAGKAFLAQYGVVLPSNNPTNVRRTANAAYKDQAAGLAPNRQAGRGHGSTREHTNRRAPRELAPTRQGIKPTKVPTAPASPREYRRVHPSIPKEQRHVQAGGRDIYKTTSGKRVGQIVHFEADTSEPGARRVDIKVTYADGKEQTLFTGADHKRSGEHAISVDVLDEMFEDYDGDDFGDFLDSIADDDDYKDGAGKGGIVSYTVTVY